MERKDVTRRGFLGAVGGLGATISAGCAALEPPASASGGTHTVEFTGSADERFIELYRAMSPAVVEVHIPGTDPLEPGGGSGFVLEDIGIVTNAHVVGGVRPVELRFQDREWQESTVIEADPHSDLAVIDATDIPSDAVALPFENVVPEIGTEAMVIGAPLGLGGSAATGIVSGVNRVLPSPTGFSIPAAIQTDAAVNPGNSGGPLVDLDGNVIGVVFAGITENIGFAISGPLATRVLPVLAAGETYEHSYMGIRMIEVGPQLAYANELQEPNGIYVNEVVPDAPADGVLRGTTDTVTVNGLELPVGGDVIVGVDGEDASFLDAFQTHMALETEPHETVNLDVYRDSRRETIELALGTRPATSIV